MEVVQQKDELLWNICFELSTKAAKTYTINIEDDYSSGESSDVLSSQGNMSPVHADSLDTPEAE